ncbi:hypothetical protein [Niallia sp. NCCP-28]|uniref:hypothetical protein n=1 Tax=Niallia sp. NCCP-28 TaxID=2934712 RepID=UPI0020BF80FF|nr:hypothetical protein [Niallia sp. NCCP-28]
MIFLYGLLCLLAIEELTVLLVKRIINGPFRFEIRIKKQWSMYRSKWKNRENAA